MLLANALAYTARRTPPANRRGSQYQIVFCSFVLIIMTIAAMSSWARKNPARLNAAGAGALFSSITTHIELLAILVMSNIQLLRY